MSKISVDTDLIRELAKLLDETDLSEIEVADGERRLRVARNIAPAVLAAAPQAAPAPQAAERPAAEAPGAEEAEPADQPGLVKSPMVGTVYASAEPGANPFVQVGDAVSTGDTLLIIEAMKVMNPIAAPVAGTVKKIYFENEQPVEFGEPLVLIE